MSGIRKLCAKDRYGIVRGSIVLVALLLFCAVLVLEMLTSLGRASVRARAEDTASRVVAQFEQMVRNGFKDLYGAASLINEDPTREDMFLDALFEFNPSYSEVGVLSDSVLHHRDGSSTSIEYSTAYIYTVDSVPRGRVLALTDGSLLLCATISDGRELAARYDIAAVDSILGSSFREDYEFAVYNAATGAYLVNHTSFSSGGYYDALLSLNEDGTTAELLKDEAAIAHIKDYAGGVYIAQERSAIRPWNISLVIPESVVSAYVWDMGWMLYVIAGTVLLVLLVHAFFTFVSVRRMRADRREAANALEDSARMLDDMARQAQVTLFIYHRGQEHLMQCYDGLGLIDGDGRGRKLTSLQDLEAACGLDEDEAERLHDRLSALKRGDSAEITLRGTVPDRAERMLRVELHAHAQDGEVVVCSVRDCTQEMVSQTRAEVEKNYLEVTTPRTVAVWTINVSRNLWRNSYMKDPGLLGPLGALQNASWRDFTADMGTILREYIYPADYADHVQQMSVPVIAESFRSGCTEFDTDYRVCSKSMENYAWHRMHVRIFSDPGTGDILAHVFVFNVDVEKNAELERGERKKIFKKTMRALSGIFYALYYVDLDNDLCYAAKSYDGEVVTKLSAPYRETFDRYLESVHPDDREELRNMLDAFVIRRNLNESTKYQRREYRRWSGDEYRWATLILQPARYENGRVKDVVIAMRHMVNKPNENDIV